MMMDGVSQIWADLGLVGHKAFQARQTGKSQQLGPHRPRGLQEVRKMFAFLCIVSSDTPVLAMRPKVSCLRACALCWRPHRVGMTENTRQVPEVTPPSPVSCIWGLTTLRMEWVAKTRRSLPSGRFPV